MMRDGEPMNESERNEIKSAVAEAVTESGVLTDSEVRRIVKETVHETLRHSGIDPDDAEANAADRRYVRDWRQTTDSIKRKSLFAAITLVVTGIAGLLWMGLKSAMKQ